MEKRQYLLLMHLSQFAGYVIPLAGLIAPIVMWANKKDEDFEVDLHGRVIINWLITVLILAFIGIILSFLFIGIPLLIALGFCGVAFPIIGAVKASDDNIWIYPFSIDVMGVKERINNRYF